MPPPAITIFIGGRPPAAPAAPAPPARRKLVPDALDGGLEVPVGVSMAMEPPDLVRAPSVSLDGTAGDVGMWRSYDDQGQSPTVASH